MNTKREEMKAKIFYLGDRGIKEESGTWPTHPGFHRGFSIPLSHFMNRQLSWTESSRSDSWLWRTSECLHIYYSYTSLYLLPSILSDISCMLDSKAQTLWNPSLDFLFNSPYSSFQISVFLFSFHVQLVYFLVRQSTSIRHANYIDKLNLLKILNRFYYSHMILFPVPDNKRGK